MTPFGLFLQDIRRDRKLAQKQLAGLLDVDQSYVSRLESGRKGVPASMVARLTETLNLQARIRIGRLFTSQELDALVHACRTRADGHVSDEVGRYWKLSSTGTNSRGARQSNFVSTAVTADRLSIIREFVIWSVRKTNPLSIDANALTRDFRRLMASRSPPIRVDLSSQREGLFIDEMQLLLDIVKPGGASNPWVDGHTQKRNYLIVLWLLRLGLCRDELLGVRISDIDFLRARVTRSLAVRLLQLVPHDVLRRWHLGMRYRVTSSPEMTFLLQIGFGLLQNLRNVRKPGLCPMLGLFRRPGCQLGAIADIPGIESRPARTFCTGQMDGCRVHLVVLPHQQVVLPPLEAIESCIFETQCLYEAPAKMGHIAILV